MAEDFPTSEVERRRPVRAALSEFWLDTELTEDDLRPIAGVLAESGYTTKELEHIYRREVAPAVFLNAYSVAGVWEGFDQSWLAESIVRRGKAKRIAVSLSLKLGLGRLLMTWETEQHWERVLALMEG